MARERGNVVSPRLGESAQAVDEEDGGTLPGFDVVETKPVELASRELDLGHVRRRGGGTATRGTGRG